MKNKRAYVLVAFTALALASRSRAQDQPISRQHNSTPQQALDKRQDAFQGDKAKGVHASYQWELSGPNGGDWLDKRKSRLLFIFNLVGVLSTLMLAWILYTQVVVIRHHWAACGRRGQTGIRRRRVNATID